MILNYKIRFLKFKENWFCEKLDKENIFKLFVGRDCRKNINKFGFIKKRKYTLITDLRENIECLFKNFSSTFRNQIRKVDKLENLDILYNDINKEYFIKFYNEKFAKYKGLNLLKNYQIDKFEDNIFFISAKWNNELTNIQVYIFDKNKKIVRLLHSVSIIHLISDKKKRNQIGWINKALHFKTMIYFKEKGYKEFDWGGYSNDPNNKELSGIDRMKKSFGGKLVELWDYYSFPYFILLKVKELIK
jgi:hypothetical protein